MAEDLDRIALDDVLAECAAVLGPAFGERAAREAEETAAGILGASLLKLRMDRAAGTVTASGRAAILAACARRARHEPLQYIIGRAPFMFDEFEVGEGVLIPRFDTERLVELAAEAAAGMAPRQAAFGKPVDFLEIGTGSGCAAVSLIRAARRAGVHIRGTATDISPAALETARQNALRLGVADSIDFLEHDLLSGDFKSLATKVPQYDIIICNPPYIRSTDIPFLEPEVSGFEPRTALDGGEDGLVFYWALAGLASERLAPGGRIFAEIGHDQGRETSEIFAAAGCLGDIRVHRDYSGKERVIGAVRL